MKNKNISHGEELPLTSQYILYFEEKFAELGFFNSKEGCWLKFFLKT